MGTSGRFPLAWPWHVHTNIWFNKRIPTQQGCLSSFFFNVQFSVITTLSGVKDSLHPVYLGCPFKHSYNSFKLWLFAAFLWNRINNATLEKLGLILHSLHRHKVPLCLWITWGDWEWWGKENEKEKEAACVNCTETRRREKMKDLIVGKENCPFHIE